MGSAIPAQVVPPWCKNTGCASQEVQTISRLPPWPLLLPTSRLLSWVPALTSLSDGECPESCELQAGMVCTLLIPGRGRQMFLAQSQILGQLGLHREKKPCLYCPSPAQELSTETNFLVWVMMLHHINRNPN